MKGRRKTPQPLKEWSKYNIPRIHLTVTGEGWDILYKRMAPEGILQHKEWWGADGVHRIPKRSKGGYAKWPIMPPILL